VNPEYTLLADWPLEPDPNPFAQKGTHDGALPNAGALHLESGLTVILYRAQSDLASFSGAVDLLPQTGGRSQPRLSRAYSWLVRLLKWLALLMGAALGVAITERAYYIFGGTPAQTLLLTIGVEILILYTAHASGDRIRVWPHLTTRAKVVAATLIGMTLLTALAVVMMRASVLGQATPHASTAVEFSLFAGLGLLLVMAAMNTALGSGREAEQETRNEASAVEPPMSAAQQAQLRRGRHNKWMACQWAYLQAYRAAAAPEHTAELEHVEPVGIRLFADSWPERGDDR
jgi:hypothetical protein